MYTLNTGEKECTKNPYIMRIERVKNQLKVPENDKATAIKRVKDFQAQYNERLIKLK